MPLRKADSTVVATAAPAAVTTPVTVTPNAEPKKLATRRSVPSDSSMTKDDYWRRREERDIQRDKDMAWSGMAQACLESVGIVQLNTNNTLDGLIKLVEEATSKLLRARDAATKA